MEPPSPDEIGPADTFTTIYKSESEASFSIPTSLSFFLGKNEGKTLRIALFDLGDTTFYISVLEAFDKVITIKSSICDKFLGGDDFDKAIVDWVVQEYAKENGNADLRRDFSALHRLYEAAEIAKKELSNSESVEIHLPYITTNNGNPIHFSRVLTRVKFEQLCDRFFQHVIEHCSKALSDAQLSIDQIDMVILVGSSIHIPKIQQIVRGIFGKEPSKSISPYEADAIASLIHGGQFVSQNNEISLIQVHAISSKLASKAAKQPIITSAQFDDSVQITSLSPRRAKRVSSLSSEQEGKKSSLSPQKAEELAKKVSSALSKWTRYKRFHQNGWTYSSLSKNIGVKKAELEYYFEFVEPIGLEAWIDKQRINEAKNLLKFFAYDYFGWFALELGFSNSIEFEAAFRCVEGESPNSWRMKKIDNILSGNDPLSPKINAIFEKVSKAFSQWQEEKHYVESGLSFHTIANALNVTSLELQLYCKWILNKDIITKIIDIRVEEAKKIIQSNPSLDLNEVARRVGYSSSGSLSDQFKRRNGCTPTEWRKRVFPNQKVVSSITTPSNSSKISFDNEDVVKWKRRKGYCKPNLTLASVAEECGFSGPRFAQYIRQEENTTFNEWISKLRLEEAKRILINQTSLSTEMVSKRLGFSSKGGFISWFKQQTRYTPEGWRTSVLTKEISSSEAGVRSNVYLSSVVKKAIEGWIASKGYCKPRLTSKIIASNLGITEDQLTAYMYKEGCGQFPVWISNLRVLEAQRLLISYPSMQIVTVAVRVGMTDVKVFRDIFKRIVGVLPTEWRENNKQLPVAEVMSRIESRPSKPFSLDTERLKDIENTTSQAQGILSSIFTDDEIEENKAVNKKAEDAVVALVSTVLEKEKWTRDEFNNLCSKHSIMPGFAIERINDIAFEKVDDILIDDAGDFLYVNTDYKDKLV